MENPDNASFFRVQNISIQKCRQNLQKKRKYDLMGIGNQ